MSLFPSQSCTWCMSRKYFWICKWMDRRICYSKACNQEAIFSYCDPCYNPGPFAALTFPMSVTNKSNTGSISTVLPSKKPQTKQCKRTKLERKKKSNCRDWDENKLNTLGSFPKQTQDLIRVPALQHCFIKSTWSPEYLKPTVSF